MKVRGVAKGIGEFLKETVGEVVAEALLGLLACALLACLVLTAYLSWSFSPSLTFVGAALLSLFLAHGAWGTFRDPAKGRRRRGVASVTMAGFTLTAATAIFLLFYASGCDCL